MTPVPIKKILRLLLVISVSLWMAGAGCLLGCSSEAEASSSNSQASAETIVAKESCPSASHDCCAKKNRRQKDSVNPVGVELQQRLLALPSPMLGSCPMAISASAIPMKVGAETSNAPLTRAVEIPRTASGTTGRSYLDFNQPYLLNRGPTHLRCCVFLI